MGIEVNVCVSTSQNLVQCDPTKTPVLFIGQLKHLKSVSFKVISTKLGTAVDEKTWNGGINTLLPNHSDTVPLLYNSCTIATVPSNISRHNAPSRASTIAKIVKNNTAAGEQQYIVLVCEHSNVFPSVCAVARSFPLFSRKSTITQSDKTENVTIEVILVGEKKTPLTEKDCEVLNTAIESVRLSARIVDTPCNEMNTERFFDEIAKIGEKLGITPFVIKGEELDRKGFGGLYGVGKAADVPPILAVLSHTPEGATQNIAWVGKGIVYDTGGLSIKTKTGMPGMKRDCGGAAGILGAFYLAVKSGFTENLHAVFCLAENAVGPKATKPDDIHTMYSGRTVEINNTDAEGRLVLADGVSYAHKDLHCATIVDMATLTGAQGTATGKFHAGIITNCELLESSTVSAGKHSGDLTHALPFTPELHFNEFSSCVADMKNSAADRGNAASSCAGLFIFSHLGFDFAGNWLHIDMASPVCIGERATGYGAALLPTLFCQYSKSELLKAYDVTLPKASLLLTESNNGIVAAGGITNPPSSKKTRLQPLPFENPAGRTSSCITETLSVIKKHSESE